MFDWNSKSGLKSGCYSKNSILAIVWWSNFDLAPNNFSIYKIGSTANNTVAIDWIKIDSI